MQIHFTTSVWKEGRTYVAYSPVLDVSSCGRSAVKAKENLQEAVEGFLEAARVHGTLARILREAGFTKAGRTMWTEPKLVSVEETRVSL